MAKEFEMTMKGGKELEQLMLKQLPATVARRALLSGMRVSAKPMVAYAKSIVAYRSHALQLSIGMRTLRASETKKRLTDPVHAVGLKNSAAAIQLGPMSGTGKDALLAWAVYKSHYGTSVSLKRGSPIGRIRHGHLVEFGFKHTSGKQIPGRPFMEPAANAMAPTFISSFVGETRKKVLAAIRKHNARSTVKAR